MFVKFIVAIASGAIYSAIQLFKLLIYGVIAIIDAIQRRPKRPEPIQAPAPDHAINQIASLENSITAELELADAARLKARSEKDPYKRAQLRKKAQEAENRADALQIKIDKIKQGEYNNV